MGDDIRTEPRHWTLSRRHLVLALLFAAAFVAIGGIEGDGQSVRLPRRLISRDLVDALRSGSPGMELPQPWR